MPDPNEDPLERALEDDSGDDGGVLRNKLVLRTIPAWAAEPINPDEAGEGWCD